MAICCLTFLQLLDGSPKKKEKSFSKFIWSNFNLFKSIIDLIN